MHSCCTHTPRLQAMLTMYCSNKPYWREHPQPSWCRDLPSRQDMLGKLHHLLAIKPFRNTATFNTLKRKRSFSVHVWHKSR
jgi:hypothetical protein